LSEFSITSGDYLADAFHATLEGRNPESLVDGFVNSLKSVSLSGDTIEENNDKFYSDLRNVLNKAGIPDDLSMGLADAVSMSIFPLDKGSRNDLKAKLMSGLSKVSTGIKNSQIALKESPQAVADAVYNAYEGIGEEVMLQNRDLN
jgi:hypothetical protein